MSTYAFKSIVGAFSDPDVGDYVFQGQAGIQQLTVTNATDRTEHNKASDGGIMVSYIAGKNGALDIEMQQESDFHQFLTDWANRKFTDADNGDAEEFAAATVNVHDLLSGDRKRLYGVSPSKIPDVIYGNAGAMVTWHLMAAEVVSETF